MTSVRRLTFTLFAFGMSVASAHAAPITLNFVFSATGFDAPGAPVDPVTGSFSVTFDNATELIDVTSGISVTSLNIALDSVPAFTYVLGLANFLSIGGLVAGADGVITGIDDFTLFIELTRTGTPISAGFFYSQTASGVFFASTVILTPSQPTSIPEPACLTLLGLGLAGMGARRWRQRKTS